MCFLGNGVWTAAIPRERGFDMELSTQWSKISTRRLGWIPQPNISDSLYKGVLGSQGDDSNQTFQILWIKGYCYFLLAWGDMRERRAGGLRTHAQWEVCLERYLVYCHPGDRDLRQHFTEGDENVGGNDKVPGADEGVGVVWTMEVELRQLPTEGILTRNFSPNIPKCMPGDWVEAPN